MARQNDHTRAEELISAYLDKQVSAEEKDFFERHIASCAACREQLEATRSMVAALKAMPAVKAPRSFVLPREMGRQPKRSFLSLYPALRLATVIAAIAFVVVFAGDLLITQSSGSEAPQYIPAAAPASVTQQPLESARQSAPTQAPAAPAAASEAALPTAESPAAAAGAAMANETAVATEPSMMKSAPAATPEATKAPSNAEMALLSVTPEVTEPPAAESQTQADQATMSYAAEAAPAPVIDPLRVIAIALLALAVVLGIATLIVRRKQA